MDLMVFVAAHKDFDVPADDVYQPIHVGRAASATPLPFAGDDTGDNISTRNKSWCELTGLYWAWKNTTHEAYGLVHYRRYFTGAGDIATGEEMRAWLAAADVVVAKRRNYVVESVRAQYANAHHGSDLDAARSALAELHPDYLPAFDKVMGGRRLSLYNMFVMRRELLDAYAAWLFPVLERAEKDIPLESYGPQQARVMGYLGERLFNVWLTHRSDLTVSRKKVYAPEETPVAKKAVGLLKRKFGHGRAH